MKIYNNNVVKIPTSSFKLILFIICFFGIIIPLFIQIFLLLQQSTVKDEALLTSHKILYEDLEIKKEKVDSLERHLKELENIKIKALHSLVTLDAKRVRLQKEISQANQQNNEIMDQSRKMHRKVEKAKKELEITNRAKIQKVVTNVVYVGVPQKQIQNSEILSHNSEGEHSTKCTIQDCFDFSKCSILNKFTFHLYKPKSEKLVQAYQNVKQHEDYSDSLVSSCVIFVMIDIQEDFKSIQKHLDTLPTWKNRNHNHLMFLKSDKEDNYCQKVKKIQSRNSILLVKRFCPSFRKSYDFLVINFDTLVGMEDKAVPLYPIKRKYLLSFAGEFVFKNKSLITEQHVLQLNVSDDVFIRTKCKGLYWNKCTQDGWCACNYALDWRWNILKNSIYNLIIIDKRNPSFFDEIIDSFRSGSIPIFIGLLDYLPFSDVINWKLASVSIPYQRIPELVLLLRNMPFNDVISLKLQGKFLYSSYFSTKKKFFDTILTNIRNKIGLHPSTIHDFTATFINSRKTAQQPESYKVSPSLRYVHNFSYVGRNQYKSWNQYPGALHMYPVTPWSDPVPSTFQFLDEGKDYYMPIGDGAGGDGVAFSRSLGGDFPVELFTIIMLTYDRETILLEALQRLSGLKYLSKVIVIWNHPVDPAPTLEWPDIGVKIEVIRAGKNSLNNRFIPYDVIETEAVLSMDDDIYLRHEEIELAFRVWRENRDRLVGFPGRHHSYNSTSKAFYYNALHACELSLVLTGGAFFHKYYSYIYTYKMDKAIRDMIDEFMNCEDIAMNFLISHITRKPPIKVTSRWTFRCPGCPDALSADSHHYEERNTCMAYFEKLYGYNPLKRTQFRADSILFKTRLPSSMTKCFQYV